MKIPKLIANSAHFESGKDSERRAIVEHTHHGYGRYGSTCLRDRTCKYNPERELPPSTSPKAEYNNARGVQAWEPRTGNLAATSWGSTDADPVHKRVMLRFGKLELENCQGRMPVPEGEIRRQWRKEGSKLVYQLSVPEGYGVQVTNLSGRELARAD